MFSWLRKRDQRSAAERIEDRLMAEWIQPDEAGMQAELGDDEDARELIKQHRLYVAFNTHATEWRWEVSGGTCESLTFFCPEYKYDYPTLGDAVRACVAKAIACRAGSINAR